MKTGAQEPRATPASALSERIRERIAREGPIPFDVFMDLALYAPGLGYYERMPRPLGRQGDFFTSVSAGGLFGELLGLVFSEWLGKGGSGARIVEAGAHDGRLAADVLGWLARRRPELAGSLEYWILEPSESRAAVQREALRDHAGRVRWARSWESMPAACGPSVVFSNELLDAMPVRRWGWDAALGCWFEWGVDWDGARFVWARLAGGNATRGGAPALPEDELKDGFVVETCEAAAAWWGQAAEWLREGWLVAFDYGLATEERLAGSRRDGTLRAYLNHQLLDDVLADPGGRDLTAHADFSGAEAAGLARGLKTVHWMEQGRFLTAAGMRLWREEGAEWGPDRVRQFQTLTHPGWLGRAFQVLAQEKRC